MKKLLIVGLLVTAVNARDPYHNYHTCMMWEIKHYKAYDVCQRKYPEQYALSLRRDGLDKLIKNYALACSQGNLEVCRKVQELIEEANELRARLMR